VAVDGLDDKVKAVSVARGVVDEIHTAVWRPVRGRATPRYHPLRLQPRQTFHYTNMDHINIWKHFEITISPATGITHFKMQNDSHLKMDTKPLHFEVTVKSANTIRKKVLAQCLKDASLQP
jgi:hypothetical protein